MEFVMSTIAAAVAPGLTPREPDPARSRQAAGKSDQPAVDLVYFVAILFVYAVAVVALAIAAPLMLAISAVASAFTQGGGNRSGHWRRAPAA